MTTEGGKNNDFSHDDTAKEVIFILRPFCSYSEKVVNARGGEINKYVPLTSITRESEQTA